jgi:hypothetical protein
MMALWREDLSSDTLADVLNSQAQNRAWSKELRQRTNSLINERLAKNISQADYLANRKLGREEASECRRRAAILDEQLVRHSIASLARQG